MSITGETIEKDCRKNNTLVFIWHLLLFGCLRWAKSFLHDPRIALTFAGNFIAMLKMLFMLAVIYIAYRMFTYQPVLPGRKPQDHIRNPHQNDSGGKQGNKANSKYDDDYIDYEELK